MQRTDLEKLYVYTKNEAYLDPSLDSMQTQWWLHNKSFLNLISFKK
jgi:hypothetical protein